MFVFLTKNKIMSFRYFMELAYKGTNYHGWQIQPNAISVQETINQAITTLLRKPINLVGAGRTDTGVHASFFVAHFDYESEIADCQHLTYRLNRFLPKDIAIRKIFQVKKNIHSRFDALLRSYRYIISRQKDPFSIHLSHFYPFELDVKKMNDAAGYLFDYKDFTSFSKLHTDTKTNFCKIHFARWEAVETELIFTIKADRFLRNMVRAIVGTLLEVGRGKISLNDFRQIIESKNRSNAGVSISPDGLYLSQIEYPNDIAIFS